MNKKKKSSEFPPAFIPLQVVHPGLVRQRNLRSRDSGAEQLPVEGKDSQLHQTGGCPSSQPLSVLPLKQSWAPGNVS